MPRYQSILVFKTVSRKYKHSEIDQITKQVIFKKTDYSVQKLLPTYMFFHNFSVLRNSMNEVWLLSKNFNADCITLKQVHALCVAV